MAAIADCTDALKIMGATAGSVQLSQLNHLIDLTKTAIKQDPAAFAKTTSHNTLPVPRVPSKDDDQTQIHMTRSMTNQT